MTNFVIGENEIHQRGKGFTVVHPCNGAILAYCDTELEAMQIVAELKKIANKYNTPIETGFRTCPIYLKGNNTAIIAEGFTFIIETPKILWNCLEDYDKKTKDEIEYNCLTRVIFRRAEK